MIPALFVILDNTLITTISKQKYALHREDWKFINSSVSCLKEYYDKGYKVFIISNQPAIRDNITPDKAFNAKMHLILNTLERDLKIPQHKIKYSYSVEDEEGYSFLPNPGLILNLALKHRIDLSKSVLLGNSIYDKAILLYSGIKTYIHASNLII